MIFLSNYKTKCFLRSSELVSVVAVYSSGGRSSSSVYSWQQKPLFRPFWPATRDVSKAGDGDFASRARRLTYSYSSMYFSENRSGRLLSGGDNRGRPGLGGDGKEISTCGKCSLSFREQGAGARRLSRGFCSLKVAGACSIIAGGQYSPAWRAEHRRADIISYRRQILACFALAAGYKFLMTTISL